MPEAKPTALLIHNDPKLLDKLTRLFEGRGYTVTIAPTPPQAMVHVQAGRNHDIIVAGWDAKTFLGGLVYRWVLNNRKDLANKFIFLAEELPSEFDKLVGGRCLAARPSDLDEVVRMADAQLGRSSAPSIEAPSKQRADVPTDQGWVDDRPSMLLADDDPMLLGVMARLFGDAGFAVSPVDGGTAAIQLLERSEFDVIVADWNMAQGSGADLYKWIKGTKPRLTERVVFITGTSVRDVSEIAPGRPIVPKGQDSPELMKLINNIARQKRRA